MAQSATVAITFASLLLISPPALSQDERISDGMTEGWRSVTLTDTVRSKGKASELRFPTPDELTANPKIAELNLQAELRLNMPGTRAVLMSENQVVILEKYVTGKSSPRSTPIGNSISKSLVALTVGKALCDGSIKSINDKADQYVSGLSGTSWGNSSVRDLLRMASGAFRPDASVGSGFKNHRDTMANRAIYSKSLRTDYIEMMKVLDDRRTEPGREFNYNNYDTNALALIVESATKKKFAKYFEETIWQEAGAERSGAWITNNQGQVAGYFGFSATPRDWLRLGHYVLNELNKPGCFSDFLRDATREQIPANWTFMKSYGYQIWTNCTRKAGSFCFLGFGGQQLIMHPGSNTVLYVHGTMNESAPPWRQIFDNF
jgi:CubicO group peptidase (beta-lactamase class C family)